MAFTQNGAISYGQTEDPFVNLMFKAVRGVECEDYCSVPAIPRKNLKDTKTDSDSDSDSDSDDFVSKVNSDAGKLETMFQAAWDTDPLMALRAMFALRDCREGNGEKQIFRALFRHLRTSGHIEHLRQNLKHVPEYGCWKDILQICCGTELEAQGIKLFANQLTRDLVTLNPTSSESESSTSESESSTSSESESDSKSIRSVCSLAAKYAPSEGNAFDKKFKVTAKLARAMKMNKSDLRKTVYRPLREKIACVETFLCKKQYESINYEHVPSVAGKMYSATFKKHDSVRYNEYLAAVMKGTKKMNSSLLYPYQIVAECHDDERSAFCDAAWKSYLDKIRIKITEGTIPMAFTKILPLVDVSGSMESRIPGTTISAMTAAISMGLLFASINENPTFHHKYLTFESNPRFGTVTGDTLTEQVRQIKAAPWGGSTNLGAAFDLLLTTAVSNSIHPDAMPETLIVFSDMQFDQADHNNHTNWISINDKFSEAGYTRPQLVFWNLTAKAEEFPLPSATVPNTLMFSGFSEKLFKMFIEGENPRDAVYAALNSERYWPITLA